ncbi:flagellin [Candidatus Bandiella numerosa]|uniref:flagellin n=1 Tax=Candidatus Bandiella numerosa TaxID=2570586 RepID=UPI00249E8363|nr:flagellin [Candidatus Bandiella numerosa]WHA05426.1 flagellin [Candidatus Bandiella numerosa]
MSIPSITNTQTAGVQDQISRILENSSTIANKISSGEGILFPYEDPAGLAIGTKLEINLGVQKEALKSAHQASVVLNIAYGGTKGVVNILKRLDQLSIMALTGSASDSDRKLIDLEAQQLKAEINRISTGTEFNGRKLIDGSTENGATFNVAEGMQLKVVNNNTGTGIDKSGIVDSTGNQILKYTSATGAFDLVATTNYADDATAASSGSGATKKGDYILDTSGKAIYQVDKTSKKIESVDGTKSYFTVDNLAGIKAITVVGGTNIAIAHSAAGAKPATTTITQGSKVVDFEGTKPAGNPIVFQVGVESDQRISIGFDSVKTADLGIDKIELTSVQSAEDAQAQIDKTLEIMFEYNSKIGAYQSRFRMVADSISTAIENVDAARAQFLDADFTQLTKDFSQEQAKLTAAIAAEAKLIQTPHHLLQLIQSI